MKTVSIGKLRQNPTGTFDDVERGETVVVTRYRKEIGRIVPSGEERYVPSGREVMEAMQRSPLAREDKWAEELERDRAADHADDPWAA